MAPSGDPLTPRDVETAVFPLPSVSTNWDSHEWCSRGQTSEHHPPTSFLSLGPRYFTDCQPPGVKGGDTSSEPQHSRGKVFPGVVADCGSTTPEPQHHTGRGISVVVADCGLTTPEPQHSRGTVIPGVVAEVVSPCTEPLHQAWMVVAGAARRIDGVFFWPGAPCCMVDWVWR